jgi:hypothetical protein
VITIFIVPSKFQDLMLAVLWEVLRLRRTTRSTAACRVVLGSFTALLLFAFFRVGRSSATASTASSPSTAAAPWYHRDGHQHLSHESALTPRVMLRPTAASNGLPLVGPCDDGTPMRRVRGFHLDQRTASPTTSPASLRTGTAGSFPTAPVAWLCPG